MTRCAVVIGINKTGDLPVLHAAASGARQFASWATAQGIDVTLLTDESGSVSLGDVKTAIRNYVQQRTFSQLIVFFSGHGVLRSPDYELWLLSGAPDDPDDAVNVPGSIWLARNVGIPHVVVISDACRSRPSTSRLSQVQGGVIFPNEFPRTPRPAVDVFYAALPGDPALEVSAKDATDNYRGIFTDCLLKGLSGNIPELIVNIGHSHLNEEKWVVPSWELKPYLEQEVPGVAASVHIKLRQEPDIRVESHPPNYLAEFTRHNSAADKRTRLTTLAEHVTYRPVTHQDERLLQDGHRDGLLSPNTKMISERSKMAGAIKRLMDTKGRESFETRTGFSVIGTVVERAVVTSSGCDVFEEKGAYQVRVPHESGERNSRSALVQIKGGSVIPLAVLPGYIGTVVVEGGRVVTVTYLPSQHTSKYYEYQNIADVIEKRRAFVAVAARNGLFRLNDGKEGMKIAKDLRILRSIDPTLELYSAYAYAQAGDYDGIESIYKHMSYEREPFLFDVAMLANHLHFLSATQGVTPFCPMLSQGWAFVDANEIRLPAVVRSASKSLQPGLWTTFGKRGVAKLWSFVENGGVI